MENVIKPTEKELAMYQTLVAEADEHQMDFLANEYFSYITSNDNKKISFARFVIDKLIHPIRETDTISYIDDKGSQHYLYCLVRRTIEGNDYLIFAKVIEESETINEKEVYLFKVVGRDEIGIEEIDICEKSEDSARILMLMDELDEEEVEDDVQENS